MYHFLFFFYQFVIILVCNNKTELLEGMPHCHTSYNMIEGINLWWKWSPTRSIFHMKQETSNPRILNLLYWPPRHVELKLRITFRLLVWVYINVCALCCKEPLVFIALRANRCYRGIWVYCHWEGQKSVLKYVWLG